MQWMRERHVMVWDACGLEKLILLGLCDMHVGIVVLYFKEMWDLEV